jgi:hypothetical protein
MHYDLDSLTPTFVTESTFVIVESLVKNRCKGKFLKLYLLACLLFFFNLLNFVLSSFFVGVTKSMSTNLVI